MKSNNILKVLFIALSINFTLSAQNTTEIEMFKARFNAEKVDMVARFMDFRNQEGDKFWPIYKEYEKERSGIADTRIKLLQQYAEYYEVLSNEQADYWMKDVFKLQQSELALNKKYFKKISKAMTPLIALRFYQFELALQTEIRSEIMKSIPLLKDY